MRKLLTILTVTAMLWGQGVAWTATTTPRPTGEQLKRLADCESGDGNGNAPYTHNDHYNDGTYEGDYNFANRTWRGMGGEAAKYRHAYQAPWQVQADAASRLIESNGWRQPFPGCSRKLGFR